MQYKTINHIPEDLFIQLIKGSQSRTDFFRKIGSSPRGAKFATLNKRIKKLNLDISHFQSGGKVNGDKSAMTQEKSLSTIFIYGSNSKTSQLKSYIHKFNLKKYICEECENKGQWQGRNLVLELHHIDGDICNNQLTNLQFLCPNCHSQTNNFAGSKRKIKSFCKKCGESVSRRSKSQCCKKCVDRKNIQKTKINWPTYSELLEMLNSTNYVQLGKLLGVSDNAIRKHLKNGVRNGT
jgi:hypothetical protein